VQSSLGRKKSIPLLNRIKIVRQPLIKKITFS
jgi:hypothetical protein